MRILAELIGAIVLLSMVGIGIVQFIRSWEKRQPDAAPTNTTEKKL